jgi:hypothetical protein
VGGRLGLWTIPELSQQHMHRHRLTEPGSGPTVLPGPCCDADSSELEAELWAGGEREVCGVTLLLPHHLTVL